MNHFTEIYYFIDTQNLVIQGIGNYAIEITSHEGFLEFAGNDYIAMKAAKLPDDYPNGKSVSSTLRLKSAAPLASFHVSAEPEFLIEADKIFAGLQNL